ncbi:MAG: TetR/AcrR family transcriptional regulator [Lachnospiraceae bacterium]|nr:TetR/AcrR family transcriptional regulator [Lachnospiraceae bacterium]
MKKGEKRKQELLKIAYDMFLSQGYENTSVDEIIARAKIAKGTYYYYFPSKEKMLEDVIEMMIESEVETAGQVIGSDMPVPQKIVAIITSIKPAEAEQPIKDALMQPENVLMHNKIRKKLIEVVVPLLSEVVEEGINKGIFACDNIAERVRMLLIISNDTFNDRIFTESDIAVFIDMTEKLLGADKGTMSFIYDLIDKSEMEVSK